MVKRVLTTGRVSDNPWENKDEDEEDEPNDCDTGAKRHFILLLVEIAKQQYHD